MRLRVVIGRNEFDGDGPVESGCSMGKELTGEKFGKWTVLHKGERKYGHDRWVCRCECGTVKEVRCDYLIKGAKSCCECSPTPYERIDMIGRKFGGRTVIAEGRKRGKSILWVCRCEVCQEISEVEGYSLRRGFECNSCSHKRVKDSYREEVNKFAKKSGLPEGTNYNALRIWNAFAEIGLPASVEDIANALKITANAARRGVKYLFDRDFLGRLGSGNKKLYQLSVKSLKILEGRANEQKNEVV